MGFVSLKNFLIQDRQVILDTVSNNSLEEIENFAIFYDHSLTVLLCYARFAIGFNSRQILFYVLHKLED